MENNVVVKKATKLGPKIWACILLFGLAGQLAWMVENMYFSAFIQINITKDAWATSAAVASSAIVAALATIFGGALSDRFGKRKFFVCVGYIFWGVITALFALFGNDQVEAANVVRIVVLFVIMDCVMTLFGSMSNDAAFSAWISDVTDITNRGLTDVILSLMPIAALMIIFVGFDGLTQAGKWDLFFIILGGVVTLIGILGLFLFKDSPHLKPDRSNTYLKNTFYGFVPKNIKNHKMIYVCFIGMLCSSLSLQMWQPYMISLFQHTLGIANYVIPIALIVVFSATLSVLGGKLMDKYGKTRIYYPVAIVGIVGGLLCYLIKFFHPDNEILKMVSLVLGGTLIMCGNMLCSGLFIATARDYTPKGKTGSFQGIRMVLVIMTPMVIGSLLCPFIIKWFGTEPTAQMIADGVYQAGDKVYPYELFLFSAIIAAFVFIPSVICRRKEKAFRLQKLRELHLVSPGETPEENTSN